MRQRKDWPVGKVKSRSSSSAARPSGVQQGDGKEVERDLFDAGLDAELIGVADAADSRLAAAAASAAGKPRPFKCAAIAMNILPRDPSLVKIKGAGAVLVD